ncbi:hypothetical protein ACFPM7_05240 [Actinokineospora guangxiensis]|uniref:Uncharacterized protein n=1 Tax=Actinokineospora guangxiensis TaxID=1490288 RepID=A0ABW0EGE2_9PSEU
MDTQTPADRPQLRELVAEADARQRLVDFLGGAADEREPVLADAA